MSKFALSLSLNLHQCSFSVLHVMFVTFSFFLQVQLEFITEKLKRGSRFVLMKATLMLCFTAHYRITSVNLQIHFQHEIISLIFNLGLYFLQFPFVSYSHLRKYETFISTSDSEETFQDSNSLED